MKYQIKMESDFGNEVRPLAERTYKNCEDCFIALVSIIDVLENWGYVLKSIINNTYYLTNDTETRILTIIRVKENEEQ